MQQYNKSILLVEDDHVDIMTVKRAIRELKLMVRLAIANNGEEALEYLQKNKDSLPNIILLDINMPRMNGIELLKAIKKDDMFKKIPIVVLTTSREEEDMVQSFELSVAGYMIKPVDYKYFVEMMYAIKTYWSFSELPRL